MKEVLEGTLPLEEALPHIDPCLGCLACEPACPSGVPYRDLISPFRSLAEGKRHRSLGDRFRRMLTQTTLPYPGRFRMAASEWTTGQAVGAAAAEVAASDARSAADSVASEADMEGNQSGHRRAASPRGIADGMRPKRARSRHQHGHDRSADAMWCGSVGTEISGLLRALSWHVGNLAQARHFAVNRISRRSRLTSMRSSPMPPDAAPGCTSITLILKGTEHEQQAMRFAIAFATFRYFSIGSAICRRFPIAGRPLRIAYHDACHLANAQGVRSQPRRLLRMIPGVEICEIADAHLCCGSAGTYNIDQPEIASALGEEKVTNLLSLASLIWWRPATSAA